MKEVHLQAERFQLLAQAYEGMEDKVYTVMFLKKALQTDCQCISAFNKLLGNYLIGKEDCIMLLNEMHFTKESMWLKDYYLSRIQLEIRPVRE